MKFAVTYADPNRGTTWTAESTGTREEVEEYARRFCKGQARLGRVVRVMRIVEINEALV